MSLLTDSTPRRSEQQHEARRLQEEEYRAHAATVDRYLAATFGTALSADKREVVRQQAFLGLASEVAKGTEIKSTEAMLITCARNAAYSLLRSADHRRRTPFDPHDSAEARRPDPGAAPVDVTVVEADEDRRVQMLMSQLDPRSRAVLQLRLELELDMPEIADHLGVSPSHAYKLLKSAGAALADSIAANDAGAHSRQQRALLTACEIGTATDDERALAKRMLEGDAHARALLAEIRGLGHRAAAIMPPIAGVTASPNTGRVNASLSSAKQYIADLVARAGPAQEAAAHVTATGGTRGAGTMLVAGILSCAGMGGAAVGVKECIDHGVPAALVDTLPGHDPENGEPKETVVEERAAPVVEPLTTTPAPPASSPQQASPDPAPGPEPDVAADPAPAPPSGGDSVSGLSRSPTPAPAPAPPPPPSAAGGGTTGGGSSSPAFGGL